MDAPTERMIADLLDLVIPPRPDAGLPGAGALGVAEHVVRTVERTPMVAPVVEYGLSALRDAAGQRNPGGWAALTAAEKAEVWSAFDATDQFFRPAFLFLAYSGYYLDRRVVDALGMAGHPPHPIGYPMAPDDWTLLEPVRRRGRMYREP
jgi:hypothetical protein